MADDRREPVWLVPAPSPLPSVATRLEDLEVALRASWSDDMLAVYADQLQLIGDLRGELISLDLSEPSRAAEVRRGQLLREWFAGDQIEVWWSEQDRCWFAGSRTGNTWLMVERGLIEAVHVGDAKSRAAVLRLFLESPKSDYLHRLSISGSPTTLRLVLAALTGRNRPWLRALAVKRLLDDDRQPLLDGDALVAAAPNLTSLELDGRRLLDRVDHAGLIELVLSGHDAVDLQTTTSWPSVTRLDLALSDWAGEALLRVLVTRDRFPHLRHLVLSRHERGRVVFAQLASIDVLEQLTNLSLPALRSQHDVDYVQAALDRMPALRELSIARNYMCFGQLAERLRHPTAHIRIPTPWPWPPREQIGAIWVAGNPHSGAALIAALEEQWSDLAEDIQSLWLQLWIHLSRNGVDESIRSADLRAALDELTLDDPAWIMLRENLIVTSYEDTTTVAVR